MKRIETMKSFIIEMIVILFPLAIAYLFLGLWLSGVTHNNVIEGSSASARMVGNVWVEFQYIYQGTDLGFSAYNFEVIQVFWITMALTITLILIGKLSYLFFAKSTKKVKGNDVKESKVMLKKGGKQASTAKDNGKEVSVSI